MSKKKIAMITAITLGAGLVVSLMALNRSVQKSLQTLELMDDDWRRIRGLYVKKHPLCERCLEEGRITPVEEVHHIIPLSRGGTNQFSNLMSLCQSCHTKIHYELGDRK